MFPLADLQQKGNWELHRKGVADQERHRRRVKEAIREHPEDIIARENVITSDRKKKVKVPVRSLKEHRFRYTQPSEGVGQGDGDSQQGDVIGREQASGGGREGQGGNERGEEIYDAEISLEELKDIIFEELGLPNLDEKDRKRIVSTDVQFKDRTRKGIEANLDTKRTAIENLKRNIASGNHGLGHFHEDDLRYRHYTEETELQSNAAVFLLRDASGSMGAEKKYISRSLSWWIVEFLRSRYEHCDIHFLLHSTEAEWVDEQSFFERSESGGTLISSAYRALLNRIDNQYSPSIWNNYAFHFSDGENFPGDDQRAVELLEQITSMCNQFAFCSVHPSHYATDNSFRSFEHEHFAYVTIKSPSDMWKAIKRMLSGDPAAGGETFAAS